MVEEPVTGRDTLSQLRRLLRPLANRVANTVARAVVQVVNDDKRLQIVQLGVMAGETVDDGERFQDYGFTSVPLAGAEAVVLFPNGDRSRPMVVSVADRRHRPTGMGAGEVCVYNDAGARVVLKANGDIEATPAPGRELLVSNGAGTLDRLVTKTEYDLHLHPTGVGPSGVPTVPAVGTQSLRSS